MIKSGLLSILILALLFQRGYGQVVTGSTAATLAAKFAGGGVKVLNPFISCHQLSRGTFNGFVAEDFENGIILSTGKASYTLYPADTLSSGGMGGPGDALLTPLAGVSTYDACMLMFDFIAVSDTVKFDYIFGSDQHPKYTCSDFNDVVGCYIAKPGVPWVTNIAVVPGTTIPVCVNSINCTPPQVCATSPCHALGPGSPFCEFYVDNRKSPNVVFDGLTTKLTAVSVVAPCDTYRLRLSIADGFDDIYDSGIFLKEGGFSSANIVASPGAIVCNGTSVTFSVSLNSAGITYSYLWYVNGVNVGATTSAFSYSPADGDSIKCAITAVNNLNGRSFTAFSNTIGMIVTSSAAVLGSTQLCAGLVSLLHGTPSPGTWSISNSSIATVSHLSGEITGVGVGSAIVTYATAACGVATATITVGPFVDIFSLSSFACVGSSIVLSSSVSGGTWSTTNSSIATVSSGQVFGVSPGLVNIVYAFSGCSALKSVTVNATPILAPTTATVCLGGNLTLSFGPACGTWSQSVTSIVSVGSSGIVHADNVGSTIVTYTLPGNCFSITSIAVNDIPVIAPAADTLCANSLTVLSFSPAGGMWSSSATNVATVNSAGWALGISAGNAVVSYSLGGCVATSTLVVKPAPDIVPSSIKVCVGSTYQLSSSVGGGTWSNWIAVPAAFVDASGLVHASSEGLSVVTYAAIGCWAAATVTVRPPPGPISGRSLLCQGYSTVFSNDVSGGTWTSGSAFIATIDTGGHVTGVGLGSTLITYTTAEGGGCAAVYAVSVTPSAGAATITGPAKLCVGESIALTDVVVGGSWSSDDVGLATVSSSGVVSGIAPGSAAISYTITDTCGIATAVKMVTIGTLPDAGVITGDSVLCVGSTTALSYTSAGGSWFSADAAMVSVSAGGLLSGVSPGNARIGYYVSNDCGADTVWYPLRIVQGPSAGTIRGLSYVCIGATFQLSNTAAGGAWSTAPTGVIALSTGGDVTAVGQGVRIITYTIGPDADGCVGIATHSVTVSAVASFIVSATVTQPLCYGDTSGAISLAVSGDTPPYRYLWSTLDTVASLSHLADGTYYSAVTESRSNCNVADTFHIASPPKLALMLTISGDQCNTARGSIAANITGGISPYIFAWSTGASTSDIASLQAGTYSISAADANGCVVSAQTALADTCNTLVIHDVITPNGDGINDVWIIEGLSFYPANTVQIFDEWGDLIFEKANYQNDWGASGKDGSVPDGTYYYLIRLNAPNINGGQNTFTGSILVKR